MPRVVPSQIVDFIDAEFPQLSRQVYHVDVQRKDRVTALLRLVNEMPDELLIMEAAAYNQFVRSASTLESTLGVEGWNSGRPSSFSQRLGEAISDLRACLVPLPDQQIPAATAGLLFISDAPLRESIRADIAFANQAFSGHEWKAATVLAGAAAEALLLWAITEKKSEQEVESVRAALIPKGHKAPNRWDLAEYITVARALSLIKDNTAKQADLAKDFRNLIHPGRAARLQEVCDRGSALSALAAVELIIRDLS